MRRSALPGVRWFAIALVSAAAPAFAADSTYRADPGLGNSAFTAVSSAIGCTLTVDEQALEATARCSVPLASIRVDNDGSHR